MYTDTHTHTSISNALNVMYIFIYIHVSVFFLKCCNHLMNPRKTMEYKIFCQRQIVFAFVPPLYSLIQMDNASLGLDASEVWVH